MSMVLDAVCRHAIGQPLAQALASPDLSLSYRDLAREIEAAAEILDILVKRGDVVALSADNAPQWVILDLALVKLGAIGLPLPPFFTEAQSRHALESAGATLWISDRPLDGQELEGNCVLAGTLLHLYRTPYAARDIHAGTAKITFTSGTTGTPKGVCLSQQALEQTASAILARVGDGMADRHLAILPLSILLENVAGLYPVLLAGGTYVVPKQDHIGFGASFKPDFARLATVLREGRITSAIMVPEILRGTMAALGALGVSLPDMRMIAVGGSRMAPGLLAQATALGLPVYEGYGLSEAGSVVAMNAPGDCVAGTVGTLLPHIEAVRLDSGELVLMTAPFLGYVGQPPQVGPYRTGDIVDMDAGGRLSITGRCRNVLINSFGRNIAPEWVESELLANPEIAQAVVYGDGRPTLGVVLVPSAPTVSRDQIDAAIARTNDRLPEYAQLRHWLPSSPFTLAGGELTGSGRPRRDIILRKRADMIEQTYSDDSANQTFFARLMAETEDDRKAFLTVPLIQYGLRNGVGVDSYIAYLTEAYHHVKHTVPLMQATKAALAENRTALHIALDEYIDEEAGHEEWILNDIRNAGGDAEGVRHGTPRLATELMVSFAYDYVSRVNPVGFFGMVLVLEGTSTAIATQAAEKLMATLGLKKSCFSYLLSHGALDIEHMKFFENLMAEITDPQDQAAIIYMAKRMYALFGNVLRSIPFAEEMQNVA